MLRVSNLDCSPTFEMPVPEPWSMTQYPVDYSSTD